MSIWCSWEPIGTFMDDPEKRGRVMSYALGWSNHYPDGEIERPAEVDISHVPSWCVPGHQDDQDDTFIGPWLRLGIGSWEHDWNHPHMLPTKRLSVDIVMDEEAVRSLRDDLAEWLDRPKVRPVGSTP